MSLPRGDVCAGRGVCLGGISQYAIGQTLVNRMTDRTGVKILPCPKLRLRAVISWK